MKRHYFPVPLFFVLLASCASTPGGMILPENKSSSVGVNLHLSYLETKVMPSIELDVRSNVVAGLDLGSYFVIVPVWPSFIISPYAVGYFRKGDSTTSAFAEVPISVFMIDTTPGVGASVSASFGINYQYRYNENNFASIGIKYDNFIETALKSVVSKEKIQPFAINVGNLTALDSMYLENSIEYYFGGFAQYGLGLGQWK